MSGCPRQFAFAPGAGAFADSSSTNVVATHSTEMVEVASGFSFARILMLLTLMIRENLLTRSKNIARLWYVPSSCSAIGHSACNCLVTDGDGLNPWIARF